MTSDVIKNIIFDVGNVLVRWSPEEIIRLTFGDDAPIPQLSAQIFQSQLWLDYNRGTCTRKEVAHQLSEAHGLTSNQLQRFFYYLVQTQIPIHGQFALLDKLSQAGYRLFALTDNVPEIVQYLKAHYNFWQLFDGAVVSCDVHYLKPEQAIYQYLLENYHLKAHECIFADDLAKNIDGAGTMGMHGCVFKDNEQLITYLHDMNVIV